MNSIADVLQRQYGTRSFNLAASVVPLSEVIVGDIRPSLMALLGGALLLLLIACVNVGSLVLARSESRRREIAVRAALGRHGRVWCSNLSRKAYCLRCWDAWAACWRRLD